MRITYFPVIFATAVTATAIPLLVGRQLLVPTVGKPSSPLLARDEAKPGHKAPKQLTLTFWIVLGLCLALFVLLGALGIPILLKRRRERKIEEQKVREKERIETLLKTAKTIDWSTGLGLPLSQVEKDLIAAEDARRFRESEREKWRLVREKKEKERQIREEAIEQMKRDREESNRRKAEWEYQARSDDAAIDNLFTRHDKPSSEPVDVDLLEKEEGNALPTKPDQVHLPGQNPAPATTFYVPQEETEVVIIPAPSEDTDVASAKEDSPSSSNEPASSASQATGKAQPAEQANPPRSSQLPSGVIAEIPMRHDPARGYWEKI